MPYLKKLICNLRDWIKIISFHFVFDVKCSNDNSFTLFAKWRLMKFSAWFEKFKKLILFEKSKNYSSISEDGWKLAAFTAASKRMLRNILEGGLNNLCFVMSTEVNKLRLSEDVLK